MAGRRLTYLAALTFCGVFYIAYGQWLAWIILITVLALPWFSLLVSLPAIFCFAVCASGPDVLEMGESEELWLLGSCPCPMPPFRGRLKLKECFSGKTCCYLTPDDLPTDHCGSITVTAEGVRICDYLGLFSFPVRCREQKIILVRPKPVGIEFPRELQQSLISGWKPKSGGGYAENHELRPYRPGDSLNQIHWKLSAKTGSLIIREAMEPQQGLILLTLNLRGSAPELDRKLGQLLWLGSKLLEQELSFEVRCLTGEGVMTYAAANAQDLQHALDDLLQRSCTREGDLKQQAFAASWHFHIGGDADEA